MSNYGGSPRKAVAQGFNNAKYYILYPPVIFVTIAVAVLWWFVSSSS